MSALLHRNDNSDIHEKAIDDALVKFFEHQTASAIRIHPRYEVLWKELSRVTLQGGKRLRPKMTLLLYEAFGGDDIGSMIPIAAAQEVLHSSLLIHDDIIDREMYRRGTLNVAGSYEQNQYRNLASIADRRHFSQSAALLGGDLLLASTFTLLRQSTFSFEQISRVEIIFNRMIFEVAGGQLLDVEAAFYDKIASAETIARYKTASYSFIGPLLIGATLADSNQTSLDVIERYATALGIAYQLNDDLIGTYGDEAITGKTSDGDLREGKMTYLIEFFLSHAPATDVETFWTIFGKNNISDQQILLLKKLIMDSGAVASIEAQIDWCVNLSRAAIQDIDAPSPVADMLEQLMEISTKRVR